MKTPAVAILFARIAWCQAARMERIAREPKLDRFLSGGAGPGFLCITDFARTTPGPVVFAGGRSCLHNPCRQLFVKISYRIRR